MKSESRNVFFCMINLIGSVEYLFRRELVKIAKEIVKSSIDFNIDIDGNVDRFDFNRFNVHLVFRASWKDKDCYRADEEGPVIFV